MVIYIQRRAGNKTWIIERSAQESSLRAESVEKNAERDSQPVQTLENSFYCIC